MTSENNKLEDEKLENEIDPKIVKNLVDLKLMENVIRQNEEVLINKRKELLKEEEYLSSLQNEIFKLQDSLCNMTCKFSEEHDFNTLAKMIPNIDTKPLYACSKIEYENSRKIIESKTLADPRLYELTSKIKQLHKEIENKDRENELKKKMEDAKAILNDGFDKDEEIDFLKKEFASYQRKLEIIHEKIEKAKLEFNFSNTTDSLMNKVSSEPSFSDIKMEKFIEDFPKNVQNEVTPLVSESQDENHSLTVRISKLFNATDVTDSPPKKIPKSEFKFLKPSKYALRQKNVYTNSEPANTSEPNLDIKPNIDKPTTPTTFFGSKSIIHKSSDKNQFTPKKKVKFDVSNIPEKLPLVENDHQKTNFVLKKQSDISRKMLKGCRH